MIVEDENLYSDYSVLIVGVIARKGKNGETLKYNFLRKEEGK